MNRIARSLTVACLLPGAYLSMPALAHADETTRAAVQPSTQAPAEPEQPSRTDAIGKEAEEVKAWCYQKPRIRSNHDCECVADRFIAQRQADPFAGKDALLSRIITVNQCPNPEGMQAHAYKECIGSNGRPGFDTNGNELEAYCQCVGKRVARNISEHKGKLGPKQRGDLNRYAMAYCRKAEAYR